MLELKYLRSNVEAVRKMINDRGYDLDIGQFEKLDAERRRRLTDLETLKHQRNTASEEIASMKQKGDDASSMISKMKQVSTEIKEKEKDLSKYVEDLNQLLMIIPNMPHESVVVGEDEKDNPIIRTWGKIREMDFDRWSTMPSLFTGW